MKNRSLYDMLVQHQFHIEQYKNGLAFEFRKRLPKLLKELRILFKEVNFNSLDVLSKKEFERFKRNIEKANNKFFSAWLVYISKELNDFMMQDLKIIKAMVGNHFNESDVPELEELKIEKLLSDNKIENREKDSLIPLIWLQNEENEKLWSYIANSILPANGLLVSSFLSGLKGYSANLILNSLNQSYANKENTFEALKAIVGTKENNYKDGQIRKITNANDSINDTIVQQITSQLEVGVESIVFRKYIWNSVMDFRTSNICISRNNKIYIYGKGPIPPAHNRCRSKINPVVLGKPGKEESYFQWLQRQSKDKQDEMLGSKKAALFRKGELTEKDFQKFEEKTRLSSDDFASKLISILTP